MSRGTFGYLIMFFLVVGAFYGVWHNDQVSERDRRARVTQINAINKQQCNEIEKLKMQLREDAKEDYNRLNETLALLGIEKTPAIELRAKRNRDEVLNRFKKDTCPRAAIR